MNKDVIYIDVEDDITTIVGKMKTSKEKIIALVPPKRVGVLQSAVNMRLLMRTAEVAGKRLVLITNDHALASLAAAAAIPVAKNLQSKPEIAEIPALIFDNDDDIIDGSQLPVGDFAKTVSTPMQRSENTAVSAVVAEERRKQKPIKAIAAQQKKSSKVPDFSRFRKKLLLIGLGALLLIGGIIWAIWFAPRATVTITAKTTTVTVDNPVTLSVQGQTDASANTIKALKQEQKKDVTVEFTATGKKNVGEKASGTVKFSNSSSSSKTIAGGTSLVSSSGLSFLVASTVTVPAATLGFECPGLLCKSTATGSVNAAEGGTKYNAASGSLSGAPSSVSASFSSPTGGGTDKEATVVSQDDVAKATDKLSEQKVTTLETNLTKSFGSSSVVIKESYQQQRSDPSPSVAINAEASGPVTLKSTITASMLAVDSVDLEKYLKTTVEKEIASKKSQKIYTSGIKKVTFSQFTSEDDAYQVRVTANATVGPTIDEKQVKDQAKGQNYGDIQSSLEKIEGVENVDTKFWPFWVRTVPNDVKRIDVKFNVKNVES